MINNSDIDDSVYDILFNEEDYIKVLSEKQEIMRQNKQMIQSKQKLSEQILQLQSTCEIQNKKETKLTNNAKFLSQRGIELGKKLLQTSHQNEHLKKLLETIKKQCQSKWLNEISEYQNKIEILQKKKEEGQQKIQSLGIQNDKLRKQNKKIINESKQLANQQTQMLKEKNRDLEEKLNKMGSLEEQMKSKEDELNQKQAALAECIRENEKSQKQLQKLMKEKVLASKQLKQLKQLKQKISALQLSSKEQQKKIESLKVQNEDLIKKNDEITNARKQSEDQKIVAEQIKISDLKVKEDQLMKTKSQLQECIKEKQIFQKSLFKLDQSAVNAFTKISQLKEKTVLFQFYQQFYQTNERRISILNQQQAKPQNSYNKLKNIIQQHFLKYQYNASVNKIGSKKMQQLLLNQVAKITDQLKTMAQEVLSRIRNIQTNPHY